MILPLLINKNDRHFLYQTYEKAASEALHNHLLKQDITPFPDKLDTPIMESPLPHDKQVVP